jgi:hypothetical protein
MDVKERFGYLDVLLQGDGTTLRAFVPGSDGCRRILTSESRVRFEASGAIGSLEGGDGAECELVGIGSLQDWRDRGPRSGDLRSSPIPRAPASYDLVYLDREVAFLRGRFPLGDRIGWSDLGDTIAVVPNDPICEPVFRRDTASMEYRPAGTPALALVSEGGLCQIVGLIQPPSRG